MYKSNSKKKKNKIIEMFQMKEQRLVCLLYSNFSTTACYHFIQGYLFNYRIEFGHCENKTSVKDAF